MAQQNHHGAREQLAPRPWVLPFHRRTGQALVDLVAWLVALLVVDAALGLGDHHLPSRGHFVLMAASVLVVHLAVGASVGLYQGRFWYGSSRELLRLYLAAAAAGTAGATTAAALGDGTLGVESVVFATPMMLVIAGLVRILRWQLRRRAALASRGDGRRVIVFGAGEGGELAIRTLRAAHSPFTPVALLDDAPSRRRLEIDHLRVMGNRHDIARVARDTEASAMLIAIPSIDRETLRELTDLGRAAGLEVLVVPPVEELFGTITATDIRPVSEADLLGRHQVEIDIDAVARFLTGRRVLVTGAGGSIGSELCRQIDRFGPEELFMMDCDDSGLHAVQLSILGRALLDDDRLLLADIRDRERVRQVFDRVRPDVVFHAAALKHLTLLEAHPAEAWKTNVLGTQNLLDLATEYGVTHFVNVSTDKAADPTSVLGWSKRITERITAHAARSSGRPYVSVRFGNVLGSRGSMLEIFESQVRAGGPITVTDPEVTRYFMTVAEAVRLTLNAAAEGDAGEVLVLDMGHPVRILDVARRLAATAPRRIEIQFTGLRPGEKLHEILVSHDEVGRTVKHPKIAHVDVPPLDLDAWYDVDLALVDADLLVRVASAPDELRTSA